VYVRIGLYDNCKCAMGIHRSYRFAYLLLYCLNFRFSYSFRFAYNSVSVTDELMFAIGTDYRLTCDGECVI